MKLYWDLNSGLGNIPSLGPFKRHSKIQPVLPCVCKFLFFQAPTLRLGSELPSLHLRRRATISEGRLSPHAFSMAVPCTRGCEALQKQSMRFKGSEQGLGPIKLRNHFQASR